VKICDTALYDFCDSDGLRHGAAHGFELDLRLWCSGIGELLNGIADVCLPLPDGGDSNFVRSDGLAILALTLHATILVHTEQTEEPLL